MTDCLRLGSPEAEPETRIHVTVIQWELLLEKTPEKWDQEGK